MTTVDYSSAAVTRRLREQSRASDLRASRRLDGKVDMTAEGITRRLRRVADLREASLRLGRAVQASGR